MSRAALKKELAGMDAEQLRQIILDAYSAHKQTKEYFEFFLNPDVEKLIAKKTEEMDKELRRSKWGRSKARTTVIKGVVNDVAALNPGPETVMRIMMAAVQSIGLTDRFLDLTPALEKLAVTLAKSYTKTADENQMADRAIRQWEEFACDETLRASFRRFILNSLQEG